MRGEIVSSLKVSIHSFQMVKKLSAITGPFQWENEEVTVHIPYSAAGVSTIIVVISKATERIMLLDVGDGATRDLLSKGERSFIEAIDLLAISHGHFDHMGGLHTLLGFLRMMKRSRPLHILLPKGCIEAITVITHFRKIYSETLPYSIEFHEMLDGAVFGTASFKVKAHQVEHFGMENIDEENEILMPAVGYTVRVGKTLLAYTGDTRSCKAVENLVCGSDLAIIEATRRETPRSKRRVHLSEDEARALGSQAKDFLLIHRIPIVRHERIKKRLRR
ncbi:MAG: MBL fold metallo-hydrolase [Candidatus Thorarchaeota archaeon]|nr:MBL fold metallo-hydrolase [Candidatus Thorarchaeota archaeon]